MFSLFSEQLPGPFSLSWPTVGLNTESIIASVIELGKHFLGATSGGIMFYEPGFNKLVLQYPAFEVSADLVNEYQVAINEAGNAARVFWTGKAYLSNNAPEDPNIIQRYVDMYRVKQLLTVPVEVGQKRIGVWHLINKSCGDWEETDLKRFTEIATRVGIFLEQHRQWQSFQREHEIQRNLLQAIINEKTLEEALEVLGNEINCSLLVYNQYFQCMAKYVPEISRRAIIKLWEKNLDRNRYLTEKIRSAAKFGPYRLTASPQKGIPYPVWIISLGNEQADLGYLLVFEESQRINLNPVYLQDWATVFTLYLIRERKTWAINEQLVSDFLERLVSGTIDQEQAFWKAACVGLDLSQSWLFIFLWLDLSPIKDKGFGWFETIQNWRRDLHAELERAGLTCWTGMLNSGVVILVQVNAHSFFAEITKIIEEVLTGDRKNFHFSVGVGPVCCRPADYPQAYQQALRAIEIGCKLYGSGRTIEYAKLGSYALLYEAGQIPAAGFFVEQVLGPILNYDARHKTELLKTLSIYLENNGNLRRTAEKTYSHLNTVRYRLARIEELTKRNLKNAYDCFDFQLALRMLTVSTK